jgi:hypothetical protein
MNIPDNEKEFVELYNKFIPKGSGPIGMMRIIQSLMKEIATTRGYNLKEI